jgi:peptidoglycan/xylan/chitin deacetylase (PgdA/CDA1 family)
MFIRVIKLFGGLIVYFVDHIVMRIQAVLGKEQAGTCVILYYHVVAKEHRKLFGDQLDRIVRCSKPIKTTQLSAMAPGRHHVAITFDDGYYSVLQNALPELEARHVPATIYVPPGCLGKPPAWPDIDEKERATELIMDIKELKAIDDSLITLGSHCLSHANLLQIGEREAREEIVASKHMLENLLGRRVEELSFPFGAFNEGHVRMAREAGYERVYSITPELITDSIRGKFVLGRVRVDPDDWPFEFRLKVHGAYRWLPLALELKRRLRNIVC